MGGDVTIPEIVVARDYSLAEAARPAFGRLGLWFTVELIPVLGVLLSLFWLGGRPGLLELAGISAMVLSVALVLKKPANSVFGPS